MRRNLYINEQVHILKNLRHPNVVEHIDSFTSEDEHGIVENLNIVMSYCEGGDLAAHIKAQEKTGDFFSEQQIMDWFVQIADAVKVCHEVPYCTT